MSGGANDLTWDPSQGIQFARSTTSQATFALNAKPSKMGKRAPAIPQLTQTLQTSQYKPSSRKPPQAFPIGDYKARSAPKLMLFDDLEVVEMPSRVPDKFALRSSTDAKAAPKGEQLLTQKAMSRSRSNLVVQTKVSELQLKSNLSDENRGQVASDTPQEQVNSLLRGAKQTAKAGQLQGCTERKERERLALTEARCNRSASSPEVQRSSAWSDMGDPEDDSPRIIPHREIRSLSATIRTAEDVWLRNSLPESKPQRVTQHVGADTSVPNQGTSGALIAFEDQYSATRSPFDHVYEDICEHSYELKQVGKEIGSINELLRKLYPDGLEGWIGDLEIMLHDLREIMRVRLLMKRNPACWRYTVRRIMLTEPFDAWHNFFFRYCYPELTKILRNLTNRLAINCNRNQTALARQLRIERLSMITRSCGDLIVKTGDGIRDAKKYRTVFGKDILHGCDSSVEAERQWRMQPFWSYSMEMAAFTRKVNEFEIQTPLGEIRPVWSEVSRAFKKYQTANVAIRSYRVELEECVWESLTEQYQNAMTRGVELRPIKAGEARRAGVKPCASDPMDTGQDLPLVSKLPSNRWGLASTSSKVFKEVRNFSPANRLDEERTTKGPATTGGRYTWFEREPQSTGVAFSSGRIQGDTRAVDLLVADDAKSAAVASLEDKKADDSKKRCPEGEYQRSLTKLKARWVERIEDSLEASSDIIRATDRLLPVAMSTAPWINISANEYLTVGGRSDYIRAEADAFDRAWGEVQQFGRTASTYARRLEFKGSDEFCTLCPDAKHWRDECHYLKPNFRRLVFNELINSVESGRSFWLMNNPSINTEMVPKQLANNVGRINFFLRLNIRMGHQASLEFLELVDSLNSGGANVDTTSSDSLTQEITTVYEESLAQRCGLFAQMLHESNNVALKAYASFLTHMKSKGVLDVLSWPPRTNYEDRMAWRRDNAGGDYHAAKESKTTDSKAKTSRKNTILNQTSALGSGSTEPSFPDCSRDVAYPDEWKQRGTNIYHGEDALPSVNIIVEEDGADAKGNVVGNSTRAGCRAINIVKAIPQVAPETKEVPKAGVVSEDDHQRVSAIRKSAVRKVQSKGHLTKPMEFRRPGTIATDKQRSYRHDEHRVIITKVECDVKEGRAPKQLKSPLADPQSSQPQLSIRRYLCGPEGVNHPGSHRYTSRQKEENGEQETKCADLIAHESVGTPSSTLKPTQPLSSNVLTGTFPAPTGGHDIPEAHYNMEMWQTGQRPDQAPELGLKEDNQEPMAVVGEDPPPHRQLSYQIPEAIKREKMLASLSTGAAYWSFDLYRGPAGEKIKVHYCKSRETTERVSRHFLNQTVLGFDIEWKPQATTKDGIKQNVSLIQLACEDRIALFHVARYQNCESVDDFVAPTLKRIMESPDITKVGVAVKGDCTRLKKFLEIDSQGTFELSHLHTLLQFSSGDQRHINKKLVALARQVEEHLQLPLYKGEVRSSDWSKELKMQQILYAASDSYAGLQLFHVMEGKRKALDPTPPRPAHAELNLPIRLADDVVVSTSDEQQEVDEDVTADGGKPPNVETTARDFLNLAIEDNTKPTTPPTDPSKQPKPTPTPTPKPPKAPQIILAEDWVSSWRSSRPQYHKPRATPAYLRAYALWHEQNLPVADITALLRDPPLQKSTVATYILEAIRLERFEYGKDRIGDVLDHVPVAFRQGKYSYIERD
ncbi:MAG: hypothetical protein M1835_004755 [Candelina submexicana]|nr:MAG: hypothetical protein M1835_004755 [Candelina submexicana]